MKAICEKRNYLKTRIFEWVILEGPIILFSLL